MRYYKSMRNQMRMTAAECGYDDYDGMCFDRDYTGYGVLTEMFMENEEHCGRYPNIADMLRSSCYRVFFQVN